MSFDLAKPLKSPIFFLPLEKNTFTCLLAIILNDLNKMSSSKAIGTYENFSSPT